MIDENLCRAEMSPAKRASQTARRKAIYIELHPETSHGGDRRSIKWQTLPLDRSLPRPLRPPAKPNEPYVWMQSAVRRSATKRSTLFAGSVPSARSVSSFS